MDQFIRTRNCDFDFACFKPRLSDICDDESAVWVFQYDFTKFRGKIRIFTNKNFSQDAPFKFKSQITPKTMKKICNYLHLIFKFCLVWYHSNGRRGEICYFVIFFGFMLAETFANFCFNSSPQRLKLKPNKPHTKLLKFKLIAKNSQNQSDWASTTCRLQYE